MQLVHQIRRWRRVGLCTLLCMLLRGSGLAQTDASTPPAKPAQTSTTSSAKPKPTTAKQGRPRQDNCKEARPASHRLDAGPRNSDRPHPRALHAGRTFRNVGQCHPSRDAALSGRSRMAVEDDSRCPSTDQTRIRPQLRPPAQSRERNDVHCASRRRSEARGQISSAGKQHSPTIASNPPL
jgi:hypothetical protein